MLRLCRIGIKKIIKITRSHRSVVILQLSLLLWCYATICCWGKSCDGGKNLTLRQLENLIQTLRLKVNIFNLARLKDCTVTCIWKGTANSVIVNRANWESQISARSDSQAQWGVSPTAPSGMGTMQRTNSTFIRNVTIIWTLTLTSLDSTILHLRMPSNVIKA